MESKELKFEVNFTEPTETNLEWSKLRERLFRPSHEPSRYFLLGQRQAETGKFVFRWVEADID